MLAQAPQRIIGRTIYHPDESRTESVSDPTTREMTETTYNASNVMTVKKVFLLNEKASLSRAMFTMGAAISSHAASAFMMISVGGRKTV